jgi:uncharacterized protein (DUF4415 family)
MKRRAISQRSQRRRVVDLSDIPEISAQQFARAIVRRGLKPVRRKAQVTLRIDSEIIDWFRARGRGYQTQINSILKAYKQAHRESA